MADGRFIAYYRVSTDEQGKSGLGLEAQKQAVMGYLNGGSWQLLKEFTEIESGKINERPELQKALKECKRYNATLIIAKLDRLSRNTAFIANLLETDTEFIAVDNPNANKLFIRIMAAISEEERDLISQRTKAALKAAKERGTKLGSPQNLTDEAKAKGRAILSKKADNYADSMRSIIKEYITEGLSLNKIACKMNDDGIKSPRGKIGSWTAKSVSNLIKRLA